MRPAKLYFFGYFKNTLIIETVYFYNEIKNFVKKSIMLQQTKKKKLFISGFKEYAS